MLSRVRLALALLLALVAPSIAQDGHPAVRVTATLYPVQGPAQRSKAAAALPDNKLGAFKADPEAPIHIEADRLVDGFDGAKQAVFSGNVTLQHGDFLLRTTTLTAVYLGQSGFSNGSEWRAEQLTRVEAREGVLVISKYGQTATGDWATFDVMASTVLMGDDVVVSVGKDGEVEGPRLKLDLTTGMYRFEIESEPVSPQPPAAPIMPQ
jgi:lipopolysaccharide export system protein LptA